MELGGSSPILKLTEEQSKALEKNLFFNKMNQIIKKGSETKTIKYKIIIIWYICPIYIKI